MRRRALTFRTSLVWLWFIFAWQALSFAETILYPGSFNPFHRTHFEEVENALTFKPDSKVIILPVEEASYTKDTDNQPLRVRLFSFPLEVSFIRKSFEDNPSVRTSNDLRVISGDPVESILRYSEKVSDPDLFILVGPDVVERWAQSPQFSALLERVKLIVTSDPKDTELTHSLKSRFQGNERLLFSELESSGIRGGDVRSSVVARTPTLPDLFPPKLGGHFKSNPDIVDEALKDYHKRLFSFLESDAQRVVLPALMANGLPKRIGTFFIENPSLASSIFSLNPDDIASIAEAAEELRSNLPLRLREEEAQTLISDLVSAISRPQIHELLKGRHSTTERSLYRLLKNPSQQLSKPIKAKRKSLFFDPFGTWSSALTSLMKPFTQLDISDPQEITALSYKQSPGFIDVYRGIKNRAEIELLVQEILKSGFVSKVALKSSKTGSPDGDFSASERDLLRRGLQSAILEHVFGDYHHTSPFVATTLKKEIAEGFAGKDGFVFKIRVPIQGGYFLNDLVFWKKTPWEKRGNPFRYLNEFIIPHKIGAEQILEARKVGEEPVPLPTVPLIQRTRSLKIVPFKLRNTLEKTAAHLCADLFHTLKRKRLQ